RSWAESGTVRPRPDLAGLAGARKTPRRRRYAPGRATSGRPIRFMGSTRSQGARSGAPARRVQTIVRRRPMTDRNRYNRSGRYPRERDERSWRDQEEQFSSERGRQPGYDEDYGEQMSETRAGFRQGQGNYESGWDRDSRYGQGGSGYSRGGGEYRSRLEDDYGPASSYFQGAPGWRHSGFTMEDQNGRDFNAPTSPNYGGYGATGAFFGSGLYGGGAGFRPSYRPSRSDEDGHRGRDRNSRDWFDRAGDEVMSWFGDKDAARRRQMDHRGRGPQNYTRSD